jgi:hypothetical protein
MIVVVFFTTPAPFSLLREHIYGRHQYLVYWESNMAYTGRNTSNPCNEFLRTFLVDLFVSRLLHPTANPSRRFAIPLSKDRPLILFLEK